MIKMSSAVRTLSDVLAEMGESVSANSTSDLGNAELVKGRPKKAKTADPKVALSKPNRPRSAFGKLGIKKMDDTKGGVAKSIGKASGQPTYQPQKAVVQNLVSNPLSADDERLNLGNIDEELLRVLQQTPYEKLEILDKETRYLRWLAFYYLSRRELSAHELKQKLLAKGCDGEQVDELLIEFAEQGYQSDERCAMMMVRESIRKNRGQRHIRQAFRQAGLEMERFGGLDELMARAGETLLDNTVLEEKVDWLRLAVEARTKKYGDHIPTTPKDKAKQLRFLQYRGFEFGVCLDALKMTLDDF